jgi:hypothetical protein
MSALNICHLDETAIGLRRAGRGAALLTLDAHFNEVDGPRVGRRLGDFLA